MWIYQYLRADRERIEMGPFANREAAEEARKQHASFGAVTIGPIEKPETYKLYQGPDEEE